MTGYTPSFDDVLPLRQSLDDWTHARERQKFSTDERFAAQAVKYGDALATEALKLIGVWVEALRLAEAAPTREAA